MDYADIKRGALDHGPGERGRDAEDAAAVHGSPKDHKS